MSEVFRFESGLKAVSLESAKALESIRLGVGGRHGGDEFIYLDRPAARSLASALLQWAGSDDPEWGPLIPWHGGECPLDEWEVNNANIVLADKRDREYGELDCSISATSREWKRESDWHVIAYRVRKRPPEPVEEWVPLTVALGLHDVDTEILMRDGKAVEARMAQEGE